MLATETTTFPQVQLFLFRFYEAISNSFIQLARNEKSSEILRDLFAISLALWVFIRPQYIFDTFSERKRQKKLDRILFSNKMTFSSPAEAVLTVKLLLEACGEKGIFLETKFNIGDYQKISFNQGDSNE